MPNRGLSSCSGQENEGEAVYEGRADLLEYLRKASLFSNLSDAELTCLRRVAQSLSFQKNDVLYTENETAEMLYVVCSGWVKVFHRSQDGKEVIVDMLTSGHVVGIENIFEKGVHVNNACVVEDAQLICIPLDVLKDQMCLDSKLALGMLSSLSRVHARQRAEISLNAMRKVPQRVGGFFLRQCPEGKKTDVVFTLPEDKAVLARALGMTKDSFARALNALNDETFIRIVGTRVEIDSVEQLATFTYGDFAAKLR